MDDLFGRNRRRHYRHKAHADGPLSVRLQHQDVWHDAQLLDTSAGGLGLRVDGAMEFERGATVHVEVIAEQRSARFGTDVEVRHIEQVDPGDESDDPPHTNLGLAISDVGGFYLALPGWMHQHFNRRLARRVDVADQAIEASVKGEDDEQHPVEVCDLTLYGGGLRTSTELKGVVTLNLRLPDAPASIELSCQVMHGDAPRVGVSFAHHGVEPSPESAVALARFILRLQRERGVSASGVTAVASE